MTATRHLLQAKLFYNATAGREGDTSRQLESILTEMQKHRIQPEVHLILPKSRANDAVRNALRRGIKLIVVAGGDGTVDTVAGSMLGSSATLGIIPTGTRNNIALSMNIPDDIAGAVALLREGQRRKIDIGFVHSSGGNRWFMEAASLGLVTDLFPAMDDVQHGDLTRIGSVLSTLVSATPSRVHMVLDGTRQLDTTAQVVLIANMPYIGPNYQVAPGISFNDGLLDLFVYSGMGTIDLLTHAVRSAGGAAVKDTRIEHYQVKSATIRSFPRMTVLADGSVLGHGSVRAFLHPRALAVMAGAGRRHG
jgi:YegS/Rv2252/BmrU family lipid kinase